MKAFQKTGRADFPHDHLLGIGELSAQDVTNILDLADYYADHLDDRSYTQDILKGAVILTLFFEHSTRTATSFEIAAKRLGAEIVNWNPETSSLKKGESFADTILTLDAMKPDAIIIRHSEYNAPGYVAKRVSCPVINAGDSWREHPTQALLDALTMRRHFKKLEGLTVSIVGDIAHSRVASSNMILLTKMGANVRVIAPALLMPEKLPADGVQKFESMKDGLTGADVVMTIRPQKERMAKVEIEDETYYRDYGMTHEQLAHAKNTAILLDPGPYLRNVQISDALADDKTRFLYAEQVHNGVATRMAVLDLLLKGKF
ncbi:MAG: aspartate carbamoyltransferase catalytic subunit [Micavibrio aeruginosavorus]|uniref:Aspartate carbamoyltransferase n=1 Tax=Micavibrio aeruginosavorus TaxID=349221 RepID=A0A2W5PY83_9BACT|nr:MAG: aspartate carbamoyltransferase catalytic subunit [Micavibrio aeruginosavorus]